MAAQGWQFWIDVGGTFTDSFGRMPDGTLLRHKGLSSGTTKGVIAAGSTRVSIVDRARAHDPPGFWIGHELLLVDATGAVTGQSKVTAFDQRSGRLELASPLPAEPAVGTRYELHCRLESPLIAIRYLLKLRLDQSIPPVSVRLGTTRGTNALITRRGARNALVTTRGFADILQIGYQNRPRLFELNIHKPEPLAAAVVEIDERIAADGKVLVTPSPAAIQKQFAALKAEGVESLAICLLHGFAFPAHEELVARLAREAGFPEISVSSKVAPLEKIVARGDTTVMDAYLNPILRSYVGQLQNSLPGSELRVLTSAGGLVRGRGVRRQRQHPLASGRRGSRIFACGPGRRVFAGDRVRHGRHEHRCLEV